MATPSDFDVVSKIPLFAVTSSNVPLPRLRNSQQVDAVISLRRAVGFVLAVHAAEDIVLGRPLHVIADEQIEQAIAVVIEPERGRAEAAPVRPGRTSA